MVLEAIDFVPSMISAAKAAAKTRIPRNRNVRRIIDQQAERFSWS
jgi:hypothetical protein